MIDPGNGPRLLAPCGRGLSLIPEWHGTSQNDCTCLPVRLIFHADLTVHVIKPVLQYKWIKLGLMYILWDRMVVERILPCRSVAVIPWPQFHASEG